MFFGLNETVVNRYKISESIDAFCFPGLTYSTHRPCPINLTVYHYIHDT